MTVIGFIGVLIVLRPGYIPFSIGTIAALCLACLFSVGHFMGRYIGSENQTLLSLVIFNAGFLFLGSIIPAIIDFIPIAPWDLLAMAFTAVVGLCGAFLVASAYTNGPSAYIAPIHYTQIVFGALWGALFFAEFPDGWTIAGSLVIISAGLGLVWLARNNGTKSIKT